MADQSKTVNGIDLLSKLSGLSREDVRGIWEEVKANEIRLKSCAGPHDFQPSPDQQRLPGKIIRYGCTRCGGWVEARMKLWYGRGLEHGRKQP